MHQLPNELLLELFEAFMKDYFDDYVELFHPVPTLMHVCHKWRHLTVGSPEFWTTIRLDLGMHCEEWKNTIPNYNRANFALYFSLAAGRPVNLSVWMGRTFLDVEDWQRGRGMFSLVCQLLDDVLLHRYAEAIHSSSTGIMLSGLPYAAPSIISLTRLVLAEMSEEFTIDRPIIMPNLLTLVVNRLLHTRHAPF